MKIIIAGNGIAGNEAAFQLKRYRPDLHVTIISKESFPEYDPCSLTYFVSGELSRKAVFRRTLNNYEDAGIELILNDAIISVDPEQKVVLTRLGVEHGYDKLILAYGGDLFKPPIKGLNKLGVFGCKQLGDADALFERDGKAAVVIGSGAIGIEAAEALKKRGFEVTIIELMDWILPTMFDEVAGKKLGAAMEGYGIRVLTGEKVLELTGKSSVKSVVTNEREIFCDTVVLATGVVTDRSVLEGSQIKLGKGIIVNKYMETSQKDIFACGDCVQTIDILTGQPCTYQLKHNAIDQARVVARNIIGEAVEYNGAYAFARAHFFKTHAATFGKTVQSVKDASNIEIIEQSLDNDYLHVILEDGKIIGAQAIGASAAHIGFLMGAAWRGDNINALRKDWSKVCAIKSNHFTTARKLGVALGFDYFPLRDF